MPTTRPRPDPAIPDHEVLRRIGGGAYGEVWLARGVTGALRAVKVVWREDFDDERTFEREFEGILKYEPISRDHPGLVTILHVGRSPEGGAFYYYVMELGDDTLTGREINPIEYEARTLRTDMKLAAGKRLETAACIDVGQRLSEALKHLHDNGLAHRDVKPANVIFVDGKAMLADIGLVAARGQRTFVGTEGFVPPEGPGSAQADVYSLGKVLYEMATGKDRLDFPELPDDLPMGSERKQWLALNQVICEACDPHLSKRTISTAGDLAEALGRLKSGRRQRRRRPVGAMIFTTLVAAVVVWAGWEVLKTSPWADVVGVPEPGGEPSDPAPAFIKVTSTPDGADVLEASGELLGRTPTDVLDSFVGERLSFLIIKDGYQPYEVNQTVPVSAAEEPLLISARLKVFSPPAINEPWTDQLGGNYRPLGVGHESIRYVNEAAWKLYVQDVQRPEVQGTVVEMEEGGRKRRVVVTSSGEAQAYCAWLVSAGIAQGYLTEDHEAIPVFRDTAEGLALKGRAKKEGWKPFRVLVRLIPYGRLLVTTEPEGAEIYVDSLSWGLAEGPLLIDRMPPREVELFVSLEGFKPTTKRIRIKPDETIELKIRLKRNESVVLDRPWTNSLGMVLKPVGEGLMASVWETRVKDFLAFSRATGERMPAADEDDEASKWADHPVVSVSREEAMAFCAWLTEKERKEERLTPSLEYRLPTDAEWSLLAGRVEDEDESPGQRDASKPKEFFWGWDWPPFDLVGNLADVSADLPAGRYIADYDDGFPTTAPVGSFEPNGLGLHDLCGNAQEWVEDRYSSRESAGEEGVLRGAGWETYSEESLYIGARNPKLPDASEPTYGFRVVLGKERPRAAIEVEDEEGVDEE